jgi:hypothetical protein
MVASLFLMDVLCRMKDCVKQIMATDPAAYVFLRTILVLPPYQYSKELNGIPGDGPGPRKNDRTKYARLPHQAFIHPLAPTNNKHLSGGIIVIVIVIASTRSIDSFRSNITSRNPNQHHSPA